jgi:hypothetical protein
MQQILPFQRRMFLKEKLQGDRLRQLGTPTDMARSRIVPVPIVEAKKTFVSCFALSRTLPKRQRLKTFGKSFTIA